LSYAIAFRKHPNQLTTDQNKNKRQPKKIRETFQCQNPDRQADANGWGLRFSDGFNAWSSLLRGLLTVWAQGGIHFGIFSRLLYLFFFYTIFSFFFLKIWFGKCVWRAGWRSSGRSKLITILTTLSAKGGWTVSHVNELW